MQVDELYYVKALHSIESDSGPVDVVELQDGRVLAIDDVSVRLFDDLQSLLDSDEDDEDDEDRATISL